MWETLRNAWRIQDLRKKILYTLGMLLLYRLLSYVPTPFVNLENVRDAMGKYDLLNFINMMTGSNMQDFTIMAMGITPYINSSIIKQLLTVAIPKLEEMQKEGDEGRKKIAQITRYVTIGLGFLQAIALSMGLAASTQRNFMGYFTIGICLAAGTALAMWIGERITEKGIGNGVSLLIFSGIISRVGNHFVQQFGYLFNAEAIAGGLFNPWSLAAIVLLTLILIVAVVFVDLGERRIPIQYAKRVVGRKMYGGQSTHIPLKVNSTGVMSLIFGSAIMQFPSTILAFLGANHPAYVWWNANVSYSSFWYQLIFALLIFGFTFFYSTISFNPNEISKNIQQNGGMIPGIRQGKPTADFLQRTSNRITLFAALFLALLATVPTVIKVNLAFGASSLLIAVSVAMETTRQLESQMLMRHYKGFLK